MSSTAASSSVAPKASLSDRLIALDLAIDKIDDNKGPRHVKRQLRELFALAEAVVKESADGAETNHQMLDAFMSKTENAAALAAINVAAAAPPLLSAVRLSHLVATQVTLPRAKASAVDGLIASCETATEKEFATMFDWIQSSLPDIQALLPKKTPKKAAILQILRHALEADDYALLSQLSTHSDGTLKSITYMAASPLRTSLRLDRDVLPAEGAARLNDQHQRVELAAFLAMTFIGETLLEYDKSGNAEYDLRSVIDGGVWAAAHGWRTAASGDEAGRAIALQSLKQRKPVERRQTRSTNE